MNFMLVPLKICILCRFPSKHAPQGKSTFIHNDSRSFFLESTTIYWRQFHGIQHACGRRKRTVLTIAWEIIHSEFIPRYREYMAEWVGGTSRNNSWSEPIVIRHNHTGWFIQVALPATYRRRIKFSQRIVWQDLSWLSRIKAWQDRLVVSFPRDRSRIGLRTLRDARSSEPFLWRRPIYRPSGNI